MNVCAFQQFLSDKKILMSEHKSIDDGHKFETLISAIPSNNNKSVEIYAQFTAIRAEFSPNFQKIMFRLMFVIKSVRWQINYLICMVNKADCYFRRLAWGNSTVHCVRKDNLLVNSIHKIGNLWEIRG